MQQKILEGIKLVRQFGSRHHYHKAWAAAQAVIEALRKQALDILVVELSPKADFTSSLSRIERVRSEFPDLSIFVTSSSKAPELIIAAMRAGARGYVPKGANQAEMLRAIRAVANGEAIFGPGIAQRLLGFFSTSRRFRN